MKTKLIYIIGSLVIGIVGTLGVYFGLFAGGVIEVERTKIVFASGSKEKVYDGTALVCEEWSIADGKLKDGHAAKVVISGSLTDAGSDSNYLSATIVDAGGADVTKEYVIEYQPGVLSVAKKSLDLTVASASKVYDGTALAADAYTVTGGGVVASHTIQTTYYGSQTDAGSSACTLAATVRDGYGKDVSYNYDISAHAGTLTVEQRAITVRSANGLKEYDGLPLVADTDCEIVEGTLAEGQTLSATDFAAPVNVGTEENTFVANVTANGVDVSANYAITYETGELVVSARPITLKTASATKIYDGKTFELSQEEGEGWVLLLGSLAENQTLSVECQSKETDVGTADNEGIATIVDAEGNETTENYEITYEEGTLTITSRPIVIKTDSGSQEYSGEAVTADGYTLIDPTAETGLVEGHEVTVTVNGSQTDVGKSKNTAEITVLENGIDKTENYELVESGFGTLTVTPKILRVSSGSATKPYDGTPLTSDESAVTESDLIEGHRAEVTTNGSQTPAGEGENKFTVIVYDENDQPITSNYEIVPTYGKLTVTPKILRVSSGSASKTYDALPLTCDEFTVTESDLIEGHRAEVTTTDSLPQAGEYENEFTVVVYDENDQPITSNYEVVPTYGKLVVNKRPITVFTANATLTYNGEEHTAAEWRLGDSTPLADGSHILDVKVVGKGTDAGEYKNEIESWSVKDGAGNEYTANYELTEKCGTINILKKEITLVAESQTVVYNGQEQFAQEDKWKLDKNSSLIDGHELTASVGGSGTIVGSTDVYLTIQIIDKATNESVKHNYEIKESLGKFTIAPRPIAIRSASAEKKHDGTPLEANTDADWSIVSGTQPVASHSVQVFIAGSQLSVGSSKNTISGVLITDTSIDKEVTQNYEITLVEGTLTVTEADAVGSEPDDNSESDMPGLFGPNGSLDGRSDPNDYTIYLKIYSEISTPVYLRAYSYGDYLGKDDWDYDSALAYSGLLDQAYSMNYLVSVALQSKGFSSQEMKIQALNNSSYFLPYFTTTDTADYKVQTSDVAYTGDGTSGYTLNYMYYYYLSDSGEALKGASLGEYSDEELAYREYVYENYLQIPDSTNAAMQEIIAEKGFTKSDPLIYLRVAKYIQGAAEYSYEYPLELDDSNDPAVEFLTVYKSGVCRHFATSATMLFRALGIPARYVTGFSAKTEAGQWTDVLGNQAHAWVEVYIDGIGWVNLEVTGSGGGTGGGGETNPDLEDEEPRPEEEDPNGDGYPPYEEEEVVTNTTLYPVEQYKEHNGEPLQAKPLLAGFEALAKEGYTYSVVVSGEQTDIGYGTSTIDSFTLYKDGEIVPESEWSALGIKITLKTGRLHVYKEKLVLTTYSATKVYDGTPLVHRGDDAYVIFGEYVQGHSLGSITFHVARVSAGTSYNTADIKIVDENGNDVTYYYRITKEIGTLHVEERAITLTAGSYKGKYVEGTPFVCETYEITSEYDPITYVGTSGQAEYASGEYYSHLVEGHYIVATVQALREVTKPNMSTSNWFPQYVIYDQEGNDVTANYAVNTVEGKLISTQ